MCMCVIARTSPISFDSFDPFFSRSLKAKEMKSNLQFATEDSFQHLPSKDFLFELVNLSLSLSLSAPLFLLSTRRRDFVLIEKYFSIAIHPNKLVVATGQVCGTDRRDAMVRTYYIRFYQGWTKSNTLKTMIDDTKTLDMPTICLLCNCNLSCNCS